MHLKDLQKISRILEEKEGGFDKKKEINKGNSNVPKGMIEKINKDYYFKTL